MLLRLVAFFIPIVGAVLFKLTSPASGSWDFSDVGAFMFAALFCLPIATGLNLYRLGVSLPLVAGFSLLMALSVFISLPAFGDNRFGLISILLVFLATLVLPLPWFSSPEAKVVMMVASIVLLLAPATNWVTAANSAYGRLTSRDFSSADVNELLLNLQVDPSGEPGYDSGAAVVASIQPVLRGKSFGAIRAGLRQAFGPGVECNESAQSLSCFIPRGSPASDTFGWLLVVQKPDNKVSATWVHASAAPKPN